MPPNRSLPTEHGEDLVGESVDEDVQIGQIDVRESQWELLASKGLSGSTGPVAQGWVIDSGRTVSSNCWSVR
jgi:hypothetical protein